MDVNVIIAGNIQKQLKKTERKQQELAAGIGVSAATMSKIMNGARTLSAAELQRISEYLHVSMDTLMRVPEMNTEPDIPHVFMGKVKTAEGIRAVKLANEVADMILFHTKVYENGRKMEEPWEDYNEQHS